MRVSYFVAVLRFVFPLLVVFPHWATAQGMWVPLHLEKHHEKEMKEKGLKISADDIYNPNTPSIKDAICQFGGGCTGEMISPEGLLLTNHHCGFGAIQRLSTLEKNYIDNGYWAMNRSEELPAAGITATFVIRMEDVSPLVLNGVQDNMSERDRQLLVDRNIAQLKAQTKTEPGQTVVIRPFYNGNQYYLFVHETYRDVRLVGAPPGSIGKFGADTDNWVWPRHTGDFALFRVYADSLNRPADYAPGNQPYKPRHFLPISLKGVNDGDFTMVYGFPGRTDEYLPAVALEQIEKQLDPARVNIRDNALKILDRFMRADPAVKIAYIARYAGIANYWKKWAGEMQGLDKYDAVEKRRAYEAAFLQKIKENPQWNAQYGNLIPRLEEHYREIEPYALAKEYYNEIFLRNSEIFSLAAAVAPALVAYQSQGEKAFAESIAGVKKRAAGFYPNYHPQVDQAVTASLLETYANAIRGDWGTEAIRNAAAEYGGYQELGKYLFQESVLTGSEKLEKVLSQPAAEAYLALKNDPVVALWWSVNDALAQKVNPTHQELQNQINLLQRNYMAAQLVVFKDKSFFPDANSTLRLTYGSVQPYSPRDAVVYESHTYLDGVMEKYIPGDYEFDVPQKLVDLYAKKDFGPYTDNTGKVPVAFIGTNHTTGGNSGSPALDARGNLIGLNFDRVWEGTMSDLHFEPAICRNIMMDTRYLLFIIDKFAGAGHLIREMKIVK